MGGYICSVAGSKGGVGKTTTVVNIAATLGADDHDAVIVDADLQMPDVGSMLGLEYDRGLHSVLADEMPLEDALVDGPAGVRVLPGEDDLEAYAEAEPERLPDVVKRLATGFDVVLLDTSAGFSHEVMLALGVSDGTVLTSTPSSSALADTSKTIELVDRVDGTVIGSLLTQVCQSSEIEDGSVPLEATILGYVPQDNAATIDEPLVLNAPDSETAAAYHALTSALETVFFDDASVEDLGISFAPEWIDTNGEFDGAVGDSEAGGSFKMFE